MQPFTHNGHTSTYHLLNHCIQRFNQIETIDVEHCFEKKYGTCILLNSGTLVILRIDLEKTDIVLLIISWILFRITAVPNPEFWDTVYSCYCKLRLVTPLMVGAEGMKIFDFDNPRLLEKALSGKELHQKLLLLTKKY